MDLGWSESVLVLFGKFLDDKVVQQRLYVLVIGHVSRGTKNGVVTNGMKALNVLESGEGSVRR